MRRLAAPLLLLVICCGFYWRLTLSREFTWIDMPDLVNMEAPRFQFQAQRWNRHAFPLWDPYQWCGQPFLGQIVGAANPVNWPFFWMPLRKSGRMGLDVMHWYYVAIHFLGAWFAYMLCRDLKRSRAAALTGGLVFGLGGFLASATWPEVMGSYLWTPLVFLFLLRMLRGHRPVAGAALCGLFLGACWLGGHHEVPIYLSYAVGAIWLYHIITDAAARPRLLRLAALAVLIAVLTSGFQTVPGYEYAMRAQRWVGANHPVAWGEDIPYAVNAGAHSFHPATFVNLFVPFLAGGANDYLGVAAVALALLGVVTYWRERDVRLLTALGLAALLLAMGDVNVFHGAAYSILPLFGKARTPERLLALFDFAAAPLAAYGFDMVLAHRENAATRRLAIGLAAFGGGIYAVAVAAGVVHKYDPNPPLMLAALTALLLAAVLAAWQRSVLGARFVAAAVVALVLIELTPETAVFSERSDASVTPLTAYDDIAAFLHSQPDLVRIDFNDMFNFGEWYGIESQKGFAAGVTSNLVAIEWWRPRVQDLLGVTFTVAKAPERAEQTPVFRGSSGFNVYRNPNSFPRVWTLHQAVYMKDAGALVRAMADPAFDMHATVPMLEPPPALETCDTPDEARMTGRNDGSVTFEARMACRGMMAIADTWYPGWYATVDGHAAPIYQPYGALRGVVLERGFHHVAMHYRPRSVVVGAMMSLAGLLLACVLALRG